MEPQTKSISQSQIERELGGTKGNGKTWRPASLRLPFLTLITLCILCIIPALLLIRRYAEKTNGFTLLTTNHYTWTYGPTAIFIILLSLWRLLDYNCKSLMPWSELAKAPVGADRSILLDHLTPPVPIVIFNALRYRHFVVVLSVGSLLLLQLVMVFSTGLFFTSAVMVGPFDIPLVKSTRFDNLTKFKNYGNPGQAPFYKTYAAISRNFTLPEGVTEHFVFESLRPLITVDTPNTTYSGVTGAFIPHVTCTNLDTDITIDNSKYTDEQVTVPLPIQMQNNSVWTCPQPHIGTHNFTIDTLPVAAELCPPRQVITSFGLANCSHAVNPSQPDASPLFIGLSDVHYNQKFDKSLDNFTFGDLLSATEYSVDIPTKQAMLCEVSYTIGSVPVIYDLSAPNIAPTTGIVEDSKEQLHNFSNEDLVDMLEFADTSTMLGIAPEACIVLRSSRRRQLWS